MGWEGVREGKEVDELKVPVIVVQPWDTDLERTYYLASGRMHQQENSLVTQGSVYFIQAPDLSALMPGRFQTQERENPNRVKLIANEHVPPFDRKMIESFEKNPKLFVALVNSLTANSQIAALQKEEGQCQITRPGDERPFMFIGKDRNGHFFGVLTTQDQQTGIGFKTVMAKEGIASTDDKPQTPQLGQRGMSAMQGN